MQHTVPVNANEQILAGFTRETLPPDQQLVHVTIETTDGQSESIDFKINSCYGDIQITIDDSGDVSIFPAVC